MDPEFVGEALEDRNVPGLAAFVANTDLEFGEGNVLHTQLAESIDSASSFQKRADQETAYPTSRVGRLSCSSSGSSSTCGSRSSTVPARTP